MKIHFFPNPSQYLFFVEFLMIAVLGKSESSYSIGGNIWWQPLWTTVERFLKKLKTQLPYDPTIPLLRIYLKKQNN